MPSVKGLIGERLGLEVLVPFGAVLGFRLSRSITSVWDSISSMSSLILWLSSPSPSSSPATDHYEVGSSQSGSQVRAPNWGL